MIRDRMSLRRSRPIHYVVAAVVGMVSGIYIWEPIFSKYGVVNDSTRKTIQKDSDNMSN